MLAARLGARRLGSPAAGLRRYDKQVEEEEPAHLVRIAAGYGRYVIRQGIAVARV
jgi:hypothetical protein